MSGGDSPSGGAGGRRGSELLSRLGELAALVGALAALVLLAGGGILALRLANAGLPVTPVIASLPREFLLSLGLSTVVLPLVVLSAVCAALLFALSRLGASPLLTELPERLRGFGRRPSGEGAERPRPPLGRREQLGALLLAVFILVVVTVATVLASSLAPPIGGSVAAALALASTVFVLVMGARLWHRASHDWLRRSAALAGLVLAFFLPWRLAFAGLLDEQLPRARFCATDGTSFTGYYIGQSGDTIYLGDPPQRRIAAIPTSRVLEVWIGNSATICGPVLDSDRAVSALGRGLDNPVPSGRWAALSGGWRARVVGAEPVDPASRGSSLQRFVFTIEVQNSSLAPKIYAPDRRLYAIGDQTYQNSDFCDGYPTANDRVPVDRNASVRVSVCWNTTSADSDSLTLVDDPAGGRYRPTYLALY